MDVLLIALSCSRGHRHCAVHWSRAMAEQGHRVTILAPEQAVPDLLPYGEVLPARVPRTYGAAARLALRLEPVRSLRQAVRSCRADVAHILTNHPWDAPLMAYMRRRWPVVLSIHDVRPHSGEGAWPVRLSQRLAMDWCDHLVLFSEAARRELPQSIRLDRVTVIPHPAYMHLAEATTATVLPSCDLLFLGRVSPYKGLDTLAAAMQLLGRRGQAPSLVVAGEGPGELVRPLAGLANVQVLNRWISDAEVSHLMRSARLLVLPYRDATQSGLVGIAFSHGLPVLATSVGALPEQVQHDHNGWLIPPGDVEALATAIHTCLADPSRLAAWARQAQRTGEEGMAWPRAVRSLEPVYAQATRVAAKRLARPL